MIGYKGPLDIPFLGHRIAQEIKLFALDKGIECDLWYQSEPLWVVWRECQTPDENFIQEVQVAAFLAEGVMQLLFIPQAYNFEEEYLNTTPPELIAPKIIQRPLHEFYGFSEADLHTKVQSLLAEAWKVAEELTAANLEKI